MQGRLGRLGKMRGYGTRSKINATARFVRYNEFNAADTGLLFAPAPPQSRAGGSAVSVPNHQQQAGETLDDGHRMRAGSSYCNGTGFQPGFRGRVRAADGAVAGEGSAGGAAILCASGACRRFAGDLSCRGDLACAGSGRGSSYLSIGRDCTRSFGLAVCCRCGLRVVRSARMGRGRKPAVFLPLWACV